MKAVVQSLEVMRSFTPVSIEVYEVLKIFSGFIVHLANSAVEKRINKELDKADGERE